MRVSVGMLTPNSSNDFCMFLVGRGIPDHIRSLPKTVLNTPFGQMLRPQIDRAMRQITQAPVPGENVPPPQKTQAASARLANGTTPPTNGAVKPTGTAEKPEDRVRNVHTRAQLDELLDAASDSCAVMFFTSASCAPCKMLYPTYRELAAEAGDKATLIKIDINRVQAQPLASEYNIRATPTFVTFLKGKKEDEWSGADERKLRSTVRALIQQAHPPHPHRNLDVPVLLRTSLRPVAFSKVPPLDKLLEKMGPAGNDESVQAVRSFVAARTADQPREAALPDLTAFSAFMRRSTAQLPPDVLFAAYDLLRLALVDARVSGFFAEGKHADTIRHLLHHATALEECPYKLRIVTLHLACNLFSSPLGRGRALADARAGRELVRLVTAALLDEAHANVRVAAGLLAFNVAAANHRARVDEGREALAEAEQVELAAGLLEALRREEESREAVKGLALALGLLAYCAPREGELVDLCRAVDAKATLRAKEELSGGDPLVKEVGRLVE